MIGLYFGLRIVQDINWQMLQKYTDGSCHQVYHHQK